MNALSIILLFAVPAFLLFVGEIVKRVVIDRQTRVRRPAPFVVPVRETPAADTRTTSVA